MRWLILSAMLLAISRLPAQEKAAEGAATCSALFGCHRHHPPERIPCPRCQKKRIPANDVACWKCASQAKICQHCGRPRGEKKKTSRRRQDPFPSVTALRKEIAKLEQALERLAQARHRAEPGRDDSQAGRGHRGRRRAR